MIYLGVNGGVVLWYGTGVPQSAELGAAVFHGVKGVGPGQGQFCVCYFIRGLEMMGKYYTYFILFHFYLACSVPTVLKRSQQCSTGY